MYDLYIFLCRSFSQATAQLLLACSVQCDIGHRKIGQACMIFLTLYSGQSDLLASDNSREWFDEYSDDELPGDSDDEALDDSDDEALNGSDAEALDDSDAEAIEYIRNEYARDEFYEYARDEWPHHLFAANLNSLLVGDPVVTLALLFFDNSPVLLTNQPNLQETGELHKIYFKFSPTVLALIFNLPSTQECLSLCANQQEKGQLEAHYYDKALNCTVISNDRLAIHYATADLDSIPVVRRLHTQGYTLNYSPNYSVSDGERKKLLLSPLYSVQSVQMAMYLLENGISIEPQALLLSGAFSDPLTYFALQGTRLIEVFKLLLDRIVDHDEKWQQRLAGSLQAAAFCACTQAIYLLLDKGVINAQGGDFGNALGAAAFGNQISIIRLLLDQGADVNAPCGEYGNALYAAACCSQIEIIQLLLDKGANVNAQGGQFGNALQGAVWLGKVECIQLLLDKGADVNAQCQCGVYGNALQAAVCARSADGLKIALIRLLLDKGANVNAQGGWHGNALQAAVNCGEIQAIRLLLDNGADVNVQGGEYGSALQAAVFGAKVEVVQLLLDRELMLMARV